VIRWFGEGKKAPSATMAGPCPVCGHAGPLSPLLAGTARDRHGEREFTLRACPECGSGSFFPMPDQDYAVPPMPAAAAMAFYLQQGAGLWSMVEPVLRLAPPPAGKRPRLVEVGCGFGFAMAAARDIRGYEVQGHDPSPLAAAGRELLDLPITNDYADPTALGSPDVLLCSELIEHLTDPAGFVRAFRQGIGEDAVLLISTPNLDACRPGTPDGLLVPLLSLGHHAVLFTQGSLERLLREAGFAAVEVEVRGANLLAFASARAPRWTPSQPGHRGLFRDWLAALATRAETGSDLWLGAMVRALRETMATGDTGAAARLEAEIGAACGTRFGFAPEQCDPASLEDTPDLAELVARRPLALGSILLMAAHRRMQRELNAESLAMLDLASAACAQLRRTLRRIGTDDGDSEDIEAQAIADATFVAAALRRDDTADRLAALEALDRARFGAALRRAFTATVNVGAWGLAARLRDRWHDALGAGTDRDTTYALLTLRAGQGGDPGLAGELEAFATQALGDGRADLAGAALTGAVRQRIRTQEALPDSLLDGLLRLPASAGAALGQAFAAVVHSGRYEAAVRLDPAVAAATSGLLAEGRAPTDQELDMLGARAMLAANGPGADPERAYARARELRRLCLRALGGGRREMAANLLWHAVRIELALGAKAGPADWDFDLQEALRAAPEAPPEDIRPLLAAA
jgi:SAM-dependent methyltransferase